MQKEKKIFLVQMPKRLRQEEILPQTREEKLEWIKKNVSVKFMARYSYKMTRSKYVNLLSMYHANGIDSIYKELMVKKCEKKQKQESKTKQWNYLKKHIKVNCKTFTRIRPCLDYEWKGADSGPGHHIIRIYGKENSRICPIEFLSPLEKTKKDSWRLRTPHSKHVNVKLLFDTTLCYLKEPQYLKKSNIWTTHTVKNNENFETSIAIGDKVKYNQESDFLFQILEDRFRLTWSGTFFIAQQFLFMFYDDIQQEIASFLF